MLTAEKLKNNSTSSTMVVTAFPSSPFVSIAPPAPPPGLPPPRSGKQSPEPCNYYEENENNENNTARCVVLVEGDRQPSGQRRADHFDLRSERLSRSGLNQQNEGEQEQNKNIMEKSETTMMLTSITGRSHSQSNQNSSSSSSSSRNNKAAPKQKVGTPDWETIQKTLHYMMHIYSCIF